MKYIKKENGKISISILKYIQQKTNMLFKELKKMK